MPEENAKKLASLMEETSESFPENWPKNMILIFTEGLKDHVFNKYADDSVHVKRKQTATSQASQTDGHKPGKQRIPSNYFGVW